MHFHYGLIYSCTVLCGVDYSIHVTLIYSTVVFVRHDNINMYFTCFILCVFQEAVTAANGDDGTSDLDFGPLRRRSPQVYMHVYTHVLQHA